MLKRLILAEEPDIIGLQELDLSKGAPSSSAFGSGKKKGPVELCGHGVDVQRELWEAGFDGVLAAKKGSASDGVGLFWRRSRFQGFGPPQTWALSGSVHVAVAQRLRLLGTDGSAGGCTGADISFLGVVTHLKAGPTAEAENLRARQADALIKCIRSHDDVLLMADLNAHPGPFFGPPMATKGENPTVVEPKVYDIFCSSFRSAYAEVLQKENDFTCWGGLVDKEVRGTFDYVFARGSVLVPRRVLQLPPAEEVLEILERLPNSEYPSDHFLLAADFVVAAPAAAAATAEDGGPPWLVAGRGRNGRRAVRGDGGIDIKQNGPVVEVPAAAAATVDEDEPLVKRPRVAA